MVWSCGCKGTVLKSAGSQGCKRTVLSNMPLMHRQPQTHTHTHTHTHSSLTHVPDSEFIFANISVLLFKDPQVCLAGSLPSAFAGLLCTSSQIIMSRTKTPLLWCGSVTGLLVYLWEKLCDCADRQDVVSQIKSMHTGWCSAPYHRDVLWCARRRGLAEVSWPAESSRAVFISLIQL